MSYKDELAEMPCQLVRAWHLHREEALRCNPLWNLLNRAAAEVCWSHPMMSCELEAAADDIFRSQEEDIWDSFLEKIASWDQDEEDVNMTRGNSDARR